MSVRIIVTGSRDWTDTAVMWKALTHAPTMIGRGVYHDECILIHGGATGADRMAADMWEDLNGGGVEEHPADWTTHGKKAGPLRNQHMADLGADLCLAFPLPGSIGTWDMIRRATTAGIPTHIHPERRTP